MRKLKKLSEDPPSARNKAGGRSPGAKARGRG
eukprot:CAMPEP_0182901114 /NCGR_PEP_ID=MMETSP0034_2-20130328/29379_1 /TAXON_ID=156128 /ORGANISM="Nephroselmis pyriformis, Strain CCMP717" /LENGTH=31 /DNA_ID= /DNA_START= /DNA_END= /DNA_ORIENTATION=